VEGKLSMHGIYTIRSANRQQGFTLVELLVAMAVTGIVMGAVYSTCKSQQDSYVAQEQVTELQQNLRAALYTMGHEIRMAGFDPTGDASASIESASHNSINFTMDINDGTDNDGDGDVDEADESILSDGDVSDNNENITYTTFVDAAGISKILRTTGTNQIVAEYIDGLGFAYAFDNDGDGQLDTAGGDLIWAVDSDGDNFLDLNLDTNGDGAIDATDDTDTNGTIDGTALANPVPINRIRAVKIWLLAKTSRMDRNYTNTNTYVVGDKIITPGGSNRRRLLTTTIQCRNMGL
jgi:type IV pilus assembly protein PilW